jgi:DNA-binding transcriptional LysR family regulator
VNVHHLELFYYVARHGGISAAARQIPYGIQQPAISAQLIQLEDVLGITLFHRRPFQLTSEGEVLYDHIKPFFSNLPELEVKLRGGLDERLRIAAPEVVQRDYLPEMLARVRQRMPKFHFTLTHGRQHEIETLLLNQQIDLGLALLADKVAAGVTTRELLSMPMVLLVPERSKIQTAEELLGRDRIDLPLLTLAANEALSRAFQTELRNRDIDWLPALELGGLDLIASYVAQGFGIGLSLRVPRPLPLTGVRELPLKGFPAIGFHALWCGRLSSVAEAFISEAKGIVSASHQAQAPK